MRSSSVAQLCPTLCNHTDCRIPGFPVHHQLPELVQTHVYWVSDAIQPSNPLSFPSSPAFRLCQHQSLPMSQPFTSGGQSTGASASASVLPMNIHGWFPLELLVWSLCSPKDSQESSPTSQFESINSLLLNLLYGPTLTSIQDYWKNHSLDYMDLCLQSNVSAF